MAQLRPQLSVNKQLFQPPTAWKRSDGQHGLQCHDAGAVRDGVALEAMEQVNLGVLKHGMHEGEGVLARQVDACGGDFRILMVAHGPGAHTNILPACPRSRNETKQNRGPSNVLWPENSALLH